MPERDERLPEIDWFALADEPDDLIGEDDWSTNSVDIIASETNTGTGLIMAERWRQKEVEGYNERDAEYKDNQLLDAACAYLFLADRHDLTRSAAIGMWPWPHEYFSPNDTPIRALTKAGALIAAEIDRLLALENGTYQQDEDGPEAYAQGPMEF